MVAQTKNEIAVGNPGVEIIEEKYDGITVTEKGLDFSNFSGLWKLSRLLVAGGLVPKGMEGSPEKVAIAVARGRSLGLDAFQSMESFCVINGRAFIYGNTPLAICRQNPNWEEEDFDEYFTVKGVRIEGHPSKWDDDSITAVCVTRRAGGKPRFSYFSVFDAKKAGLWSQNGKLYGVYPQRMLMFRARGYNLNDNFGDSLKGIPIRETFDESDFDRNQEDEKLKKVSQLAELNQKLKQANPQIQEKVYEQENDQDHHNGPSTREVTTQTSNEHAKGNSATNTTASTESSKEKKDPRKKEIAQLKMDIQNILFDRSPDPEEMNSLLKTACLKTKCSMGHQFLVVKDLAQTDNLAWLREIADELGRM